jgi:hypothetical protein
MNTLARQPWIYSAAVDGAWILAPALLATIVALTLVQAGHSDAGLPLWMWGLLIVGIDVAHVYSTIYRTYLDPAARARLSGWLVLTPVAGWVLGVLLYSWSAATFWTALAYLAVFHFIRQQYGFLMIYSRRERTLPKACALVDQAAIYAATLGPLLYWHTHLPRAFVWFIDGDFMALPQWMWGIARPVYLTILAAYLVKEGWLVVGRGQLNIPRNCVVIGTALSWYVGIVVANGDLIFTLTNVVAHGIPYMALTFIFSRGELQRGARLGLIARVLPLAIAALITLAFLEEGLWDGLIWREHLSLFPGFSRLPPIETNTLLTLIVPLLAVPQLTHYVIDGVIWRLKSHPEWRKTLFWHSQSPVGSP